MSSSERWTDEMRVGVDLGSQVTGNPANYVATSTGIFPDSNRSSAIDS